MKSTQCEDVYRLNRKNGLKTHEPFVRASIAAHGIAQGIGLHVGALGRHRVPDALEEQLFGRHDARGLDRVFQMIAAAAQGAMAVKPPRWKRKSCWCR